MKRFKINRLWTPGWPGRKSLSRISHHSHSYLAGIIASSSTCTCVFGCVCLIVFVHTRLAHLGLMRVFIFSPTNTRTCARAFTLTHTHSPTLTHTHHSLTCTLSHVLTHPHALVHKVRGGPPRSTTNGPLCHCSTQICLCGWERPRRAAGSDAGGQGDPRQRRRAGAHDVRSLRCASTHTTFARDGRAVHRCLKLRATCFARYDY